MITGRKLLINYYFHQDVQVTETRHKKIFKTQCNLYKKKCVGLVFVRFCVDVHDCFDVYMRTSTVRKVDCAIDSFLRARAHADIAIFLAYSCSIYRTETKQT